MRGDATETVGEAFQIDLLRTARDKSVEVIQRVAAHVRPGMTEADVKEALQEVQAELGSTSTWHPPQIRFGENTLMPFGQKGRDGLRLQEDDIFFLDIGPIFSGHEADVGRTFVVGDDPDMRRCSVDVEAIWLEVRNHWRQAKVSGTALYEFAATCAKSRGWQLALDQANGHRIADFPHAVRSRGSIEAFPDCPAADRWILEIQIRHPTRPIGAFYEDLLN